MRTKAENHPILVPVLLCCLILIAMGITGCGKKTTSAAGKQTRAFDSASAEVKAEWDKAVAASETNGYSTAVLTLRSLQGQTNLSAEQRTAVDDLMTSVNDRLTEAAAKGDANAKQALDEIRENWRKSQMGR